MSGTPAFRLSPVLSIPAFAQEILTRQRTLARFGFALLTLACITLLAMEFDPRLVNGEPVWLKPFKFLVSLGLFSLTTAWFFGYLRPEYRAHWSVRLVVVAIVSMSTFEMLYIALQSLRGLPSHFYTVDAIHRVLFGLMGYGALILTASQLLMAVALLRFGRRDLPYPFLPAVIVGLFLTWFLGTVTGGVMGVLGQRYAGGVQPAVTLPLLGWSLSSGDWRPAHFLGLHAQQFFPLFGLWLIGHARATARSRLILFTTGYVALTIAMLALAASGRPFTVL